MPFDPEFDGRSLRMIIKSIEEMAINDLEKEMIFERNTRRLVGL
jgi:hypothetical protein